MTPLVLPLQSADGPVPESCGNKAAALAALIRKGIKVPEGLCITTAAYRSFTGSTGLRERMLMELGRKRLDDMRWEELWDASLRIRNMFLTTDMPESLSREISVSIVERFGDTPVVVRSSSLAEDLPGASFAGLHESYVNVRGAEEIMRHVKLVWASLFSDAALSYSRELSLGGGTSEMAVIVQELVAGEKSGVAFGIDPQNAGRAVIEAVYGLNKGLVDGDIEPDRWFLDQRTGTVLSHVPARRGRYVHPVAAGTGLRRLKKSKAGLPPLSANEVRRLFSVLQTVQDVFHAPQDLEWTIRKRTIFVLQARPITGGQPVDANARRAYDLGLRRSFANLKSLGEKIDKELVPAMIAEAEEIAGRDVPGLSDMQLAGEIRFRKERLDKWREVYWSDFIPFAHGVRIFGQVYNDRMRPSDPYEFLDLLDAAETKGIERNRRLERIARIVRSGPGGVNLDAGGGADDEVRKEIEGFIREFADSSCEYEKCENERQALFHIVQEMAKGPVKKRRRGHKNRASLERRFLSAFGREEGGYARELLELARQSYRLRDDDNIYLGRFETLLVRTVEESRRRLGKRCRDEYACTNPEEVMKALRFPRYEPRGLPREESKKIPGEVRARQLRGQPASAGIARGAARVITHTSDLFRVKKGEIIVCDAIDPNMTFIVPLAAGIVERRGGMLIHGAIIAREYGLPCVTGIPNATKHIKTGDILTVDGYYGLVIINSL